MKLLKLLNPNLNNDYYSNFVPFFFIRVLESKRKSSGSIKINLEYNFFCQ